MKKSITLLFALLLTLTANAQFEQGKVYAGASLTGLNLSYNGSEKFNIGLQAKAGYFWLDNVMLLGEVGYQHSAHTSDAFTVGAGGRYYMPQNGIFLGANCKLIHANGNYNDVMPGVEVGYAFFISRTVTIEPSIYYQQSIKSHSDFSTVGLRLGFGIYIDRD